VLDGLGAVLPNVRFAQHAHPGRLPSLRGEVRLTPEQVEGALREIRLALLEADVNFKVVKAFIDRVRDQAMDQRSSRACRRRSRSSRSSATRCSRCSATPKAA
jgi:signal recognition particle GTPase